MNIYIVQPVIPHYRVPLFAHLASVKGTNTQVHASQNIPGTPRSVQGLPAWANLNHQCVSLFGSRVLWQRGLRLPSSFGRGDVLVVNGNPRFLSSMILILAARMRGVGVLWWGHGRSPTSVSWRVAIRDQIMRLSDTVLLYTESEVDELRIRSNLKIPIMSANNTLDLTAVRNARSEWSFELLKNFRRQHSVEGKELLLFCGRLRTNPSTELEIVMISLQQLLENDNKYVLVIIGSGDDEERLKEVASGLGITNNILWVGSVYQENQLAPWFMSAKCFVYPGPIGLSLIHALGYGLPVITHSEISAHNPEIAALKDGVNGLLFKRGNVFELANLIRTVCEDDNLRSRMNASALRTVNEEYSFDSMCQRVLNAIRITAESSR